MKITRLFFSTLLAAAAAFAGGSVVPVGTYLYADIEKLPDTPASLILTFTTPGPKRLVVAYGRKNRKDRKGRDGTNEEERGHFKPRLAKLSRDGKFARFDKLSPDYYDIIVIDSAAMTCHEGISLWESTDGEIQEGESVKGFQEEIRKSLGLRDDRIGGWEGFFDNKQIERIEVVDGRAGALMQQMRLGVSLAESGERLKGCIHSIDVVWIERAIDAKAGWQVINRQQLYRDEIPARTFFKHTRVKALSGIRIGMREKTIENIVLP